MIECLCAVCDVREVGENIFVLRCTSPEIARSVRPGQFVNVRVSDSFEPLLRRPFSVHRTVGSDIEIIFNVVGKGTAALRRMRAGDTVSLIGPLGVPFGLSSTGYDTAVLVGGGLGVAPLPIITEALTRSGKNILTFLGSRTSRHLVRHHLVNVHAATDDGSEGFHGTVVELMEQKLRQNPPVAPRIFACGPTPMLRAVARLADALHVPCEVSLEGAMGCGFGICQGCPVELVDGGRKYALMCKDGPVFDVRAIRI